MAERGPLLVAETAIAAARAVSRVLPARVKKRIEETGSLVVANTPAEFVAQIKAEFEVYKGVVEAQKLKLV